MSSNELDVDYIIEEVNKRQGFIVGSEYCPGCKMELETSSLIFLPFEMTIKGKEYKTLATFLCKECTKDPKPATIFRNIRYFIYEMDMKII